LPAIAHQHVGLVVDDINRAVAFYVDVFGASVLVRPFTMGPPAAGGFMNGPEDMSLQLAMVSLPGNAFIELFFFSETNSPEWVRPNRGLMPHMGIQVDDVTATLARAESAGASRQCDQDRPGDV